MPSSNEAAATAVPCLIAYNDNAQPDAAFKAEVTFKTESDIRKELEQYFEVMKLREEVNKALTADESVLDAEPDSASESVAGKRQELLDRMQDLDMVEENTKDLLDMVSAVFGLDEDQLKAQSTESLLAGHSDMRSLLGTTISVACGDADDFSDKIKPYMDSVPATHGPSGIEFAAWPLIVEVKVFVRSSVLKNDIVLVDLPGLADSVASRASVAQNYFSKLSVTAVVAPIIRALNEQTAVNLMTENQQLCMQMDGKFHKHSFCVILSKMDDINVETYLKQHAREVSQDLDLQQCLEERKTLKREFKKIEGELSRQKQVLAGIKRERAKLQGQAIPLAACNKRRVDETAKDINIQRRLQLNQKRARTIDGKVLHWCIRGRNAIVDKQIQADFDRRQKRLQLANLRPDLYDGTVKTFPISSTAYWKVTDDTEPPEGFPAVEYTGIPAMKHWFRYAAIPDREKHLDMALNALHGLFNAMQGWSSFDLQGELRLTKQFVSDEVLHRPLHTFDTASYSRDDPWRDLTAVF